MALNEFESRNLVAKNLHSIMRIHNIRTQKELAEILEVGQAQLCHVINGEQYPTVYPFLANIQNKFGYTIDEFLFTDIGEVSTGTLVVSSIGYDGIYQVYYMAERNRLKSGVLLIKKHNSVTHIAKAVLLSKLNVNYADSIFKIAKEQAKKGGYYGEVEYYMKSQCGVGVMYEGEVTFSNDYMFVNLCDMKDGSKVMMTFYREYSMKAFYMGGLGTMATVGESRSKIPTAKCVGISRNSLDCEEREIKPYLCIKSIGTVARMECDDINNIIEKYRTRIQKTDEFSVKEQNRLVSAEIEDFVMCEVGKRLDKEFIVNPEDHEDWCEFIKNEHSMMKKIYI